MPSYAQLRPSLADRTGAGWPVAVAIALSLIMLPFAAAIAVADTSKSEMGITGNHKLVDSRRKPGVTCVLDPFFIEYFEIRAPKMWAVSYATQPQLVSWRVVIQRQALNAAKWRRYATSDWQAGYATTMQPAAHNKLEFAPPGIENAEGNFRALIDMRWHGDSESDVVGRSRHLVDWYRQAGFEPSPPGRGYC